MNRPAAWRRWLLPLTLAAAGALLGFWLGGEAMETFETPPEQPGGGRGAFEGDLQP